MSVVGLAAARTHLRLEWDQTEEDALVEGMILAAASHIEREYGLVANSREQMFAFDRFGAMVTIPARPVSKSAIAVTYVDSTGVTQTLAGCRRIELEDWTRLLPPTSSSFPSTAREPGAVRVTATIGFEGDPAADPCYGALRAAMLIMIGALYADRENASEPPMVGMLLEGFRLKRV